MQSVETIPGRVYSVHTLVGCTVSDEQGWSKPIAAPDGVFTAHGLKVTVSDDAATVREARGIGGYVLLEANEEVTDEPLGTAEDNYKAYGFVCVCKNGGTVKRLCVACRQNGEAVPAGTPVWVKVWRGTTELLAVSTNSQLHSVSSELTYFFEPFEVAAGDELRVTFHAASGLTVTSYQMGITCCMRAVSLVSGETGGFLDASGGFSSTAWTAKYRWYTQVEKYVPSAHVGDSSHLNEEQRELLTWLASNKDGLAGLVPAAATVDEISTEE